MIDTDLFISVIVPLRNDADIVDAVIAETVEMLRARYAHHELVLVDDSSDDDTVARVEPWLTRCDGVRLIRLTRSFGDEIAISAGLEAVIGDFVAVLMPATDPPARIPEMVEQARGGAGIVFGIRKGREREPWHLRAGSAAFYWLCNRVLRLPIPRNSTHFRVMSRQAVNAITQIRDRSRYLRTLSEYVGYHHQGFPYDVIERRASPRRKRLGEALSLALRIIVANSLFPLVLASWLGFALAALSILYFVYVVAVYLFKPDVAPGWTTESLVLAVMFGAIALILAMIGLYLTRVLSENRDRPLYFVLEERASMPSLEDVARRNVVTEPVLRGAGPR